VRRRCAAESNRQRRTGTLETSRGSAMTTAEPPGGALLPGGIQHHDQLRSRYAQATTTEGFRCWCYHGKLGR